MLTDMGRVTAIDECAAKCGEMCHFFTYTYDDETIESTSGNCFIRTIAASKSNTQARKVLYRVNSDKGMDVSFGWYVWRETADNELELAGDATQMEFPGAETLNDCLRACDFSANCVLAYYRYNETIRCGLKSARPVPLYRTAVRATSLELVQEQAEDGEACVFDLNCFSGYCENGVCIPSSCYNNVKDGDEAGVDCGGPYCAHCGEWDGG
jgi:hypothetical protein